MLSKSLGIESLTIRGQFAGERMKAARRRWLRWVLAAAGVAAVAALTVGGNVLSRYRGWTVERLEPDALSALLAPAYRVMKPDGDGAVSDRAPLLGLRRAARQRAALGRAAEPGGLGGRRRGQPRAARPSRPRGLAAGLRRAGPPRLGAGGGRADRHRRRAADAVRGQGPDRAGRRVARGVGDHGPACDGPAGAAALQPRAAPGGRAGRSAGGGGGGDPALSLLRRGEPRAAGRVAAGAAGPLRPQP